MIPLPDELRCKATIRDEPVPDVLLLATFGVTAKNSYNFIFGPTDSDGMAVLHNGEIISQAKEEANFAIMDYHPLEIVFSGHIEIRSLSCEEVNRALDAFRRLRKHFRYPQGHQQMLEAALKNPSPCGSESITVTRLS